MSDQPVCDHCEKAAKCRRLGFTIEVICEDCHEAYNEKLIEQEERERVEGIYRDYRS